MRVQRAKMEPKYRRLCHEEFMGTALTEVAVGALRVIMVEELVRKLLRKV